MTTKTTTLRSIDLIPGLGNDHDGIPFRWLTSFVEKVKAQVPDDEEASCKVFGAEGLTFRYEHTLTPTCHTDPTCDGPDETVVHFLLHCPLTEEHSTPNWAAVAARIHTAASTRWPPCATPPRRCLQWTRSLGC